MQLSETQLRDLPGSIHANINRLAERKPLDGLCREIDKDLRRETAKIGPGFAGSDRSFVVPFFDLIRARALSAVSFPAGGALVEEKLSPQVERALRPAASIFKAGARVVNATGNLTVGRENAPTTFQWLTESGQVSVNDSNFSAMTFTPVRLSGGTIISRQLDVQSPLAADFLIESLSIGAGVGLEAAALVGTGGVQPLGIYLTPGVQTVTFGGPATWASILNFEANIAGRNGDDEAVSFIAHPGVRQKWRGVQKFSGGSATLWNCDANKIAEKDARITNNLNIGQIICGQFDKLFAVIFGPSMPVEILVDQFTLADSAQLRIFCTLLADIGPVRPELFCVGYDSAVQ
jgi:HK97 family phage major capsid protein